VCRTVHKHVCSQHFSEDDFTSPGCIYLNWLVSSDWQRKVTYGSISARCCNYSSLTLLIMGEKHHPKHVERFAGNKYRTTSHLVGLFLTLIHEAQTHEHNINDLLWYSNHSDIQELHWFVLYSARTGIVLLLQNCYDSYCCNGGKTKEHYFLADSTTVQTLHSSHHSLSLYIYIYIYIYIWMCVNMLNINRVHIVMKVIQSHNHSSLAHIITIYKWTWPVIWGMI